MIPASALILPLYIYPGENCWNPLHESITKNPNLSFILIINPHNGPGIPAYPDANYSVEISRLNSYPNVTLVGYVRTNYCKRPLEEVAADVEKYGSWSKCPEFQGKKYGLTMKGIFFDETPNQFTDQVGAYLSKACEGVKKCEGLEGTRMTIHNPGCIPHPNLLNGYNTKHLLPDVTTVFEQSFLQLASPTLQTQLDQMPYPRSKCCYIVHTVPKEEIRTVTEHLRYRAAYVFVTDLVRDYYNSFSKDGWPEFVDAMAADM